eukprot:1153025-Pelagomonas_calceolata.AAC.3
MGACLSASVGIEAAGEYKSATQTRRCLCLYPNKIVQVGCGIRTRACTHARVHKRMKVWLMRMCNPAYRSRHMFACIVWLHQSRRVYTEGFVAEGQLQWKCDTAGQAPLLLLVQLTPTRRYLRSLKTDVYKTLLQMHLQKCHTSLITDDHEALLHVHLAPTRRSLKSITTDVHEAYV